MAYLIGNGFACQKIREGHKLALTVILTLTLKFTLNVTPTLNPTFNLGGSGLLC